MSSQTVPAELVGCWRRAWIEFADGIRDDTSTVIWLQLQSKMADIRVSADQPGHDCSGLADCSLDELRTLAASESSSGYTTCTPIVVGDDGVRRATAEWFTRGHGVAFQPVSAFPEPGLLEWNDDGTVLYERAPSGAYVEEWRLIPGTSSHLEYRELQGNWLWYLQITPLGTDRCRIRWDVSVAPEMLAAQLHSPAHVASILELLNAVNAEDQPIVEGLRRTVESPQFPRAPLSYLERNVYDFDRYVAMCLAN